ncbi:hypothetical protein [Pseudomonas sp. CGJS7]|uniref:hypothetical protein n=1 Tax=Pseudomonas sp. CGJS7 TaxID=3109348 RepID=UPI00300A1DB4
MGFHRLRIGALLAATWLCAPAAFAAAPSADALDAMMQRTGRDASAEHQRQLDTALSAAPSLRKQLAQLAASGQLTAIEIVPDDRAPSVRNQNFAGATQDSRIVLTSGLLDALRQNRIDDVVRAEDMLPDNTVFVLAHLGQHLAARKQAELDDAELKSEIEKGMAAAKAASTPFDATAIVGKSIDKAIAREAQAMIVGWNAVVDAGIQANGGKQINAYQMFTLLRNLRYGSLFIKALDEKPTRLQLLSNGIPVDARNIGAIVDALKQSKLYDIE